MKHFTVFGILALASLTEVGQHAFAANEEDVDDAFDVDDAEIGVVKEEGKKKGKKFGFGGAKKFLKKVFQGDGKKNATQKIDKNEDAQFLKNLKKSGKAKGQQDAAIVLLQRLTSYKLAIDSVFNKNFEGSFIHNGETATIESAFGNETSTNIYVKMIQSSDFTPGKILNFEMRECHEPLRAIRLNQLGFSSQGYFYSIRVELEDCKVLSDFRNQLRDLGEMRYADDDMASPIPIGITLMANFIKGNTDMKEEDLKTKYTNSLLSKLPFSSADPLLSWKSGVLTPVAKMTIEEPLNSYTIGNYEIAGINDRDRIVQGVFLYPMITATWNDVEADIMNQTHLSVGVIQYLMQSIAYLHQNSIVLGELVEELIGFDSRGKPKLMGLSEALEENVQIPCLSSKPVGGAPEDMVQYSTDGNCRATTAADVWRLGHFLFPKFCKKTFVDAMIDGEKKPLTFGAKYNAATVKKVLNVKSCVKGSVPLLQQLLQIENRKSMEEILQMNLLFGKFFEK